MSYQPKHLGHVNIYVRNVERSHKWYSDLLGLHTYAFYPGRAAFMSADLDKSHEVALIEVGEEAPGQQPGEVGLNVPGAVKLKVPLPTTPAAPAFCAYW